MKPSDPRRILVPMWMPDWMGSARFRLTVVYSVILFGLAALVVGGIYLGLAARLDDEHAYRQVNVTRVIPTETGVVVQGDLVQAEMRNFEEAVNEAAMEQLRNYSFAALILLFIASLGVGWVVAGRALAPIHRITAVARDIQATDLTRRIQLGGPPDELRELADTFDGMLGRIDEAFESQRRFIHEASHELRNPLAVIRTNLDVTLADDDASAEELRETAEVVRSAADRMSHLVDDLLVYARQEVPAFEMEPVDVAEVVALTGAEFRAPADARSVRLEIGAPDRLWVVGDPVALRQSVANLLANACRVAPAGSRIRLAAGRHEGWVWLAVEDEGPGIPPELQGTVFQRFWRGDDGAAPGERRSGLGLTIVRQIVEAHHGEVRLASDVGRGATFSIWLPESQSPPDL